MALASPTMSLAASQAPEAATQLEDVIVTALKREENVQVAPLSITALSGSNLAKDRVLSIQDLGRNVTGLSFSASTPQSHEINIRGVLNTRLSSPTADQSVSTFVDDVYVSRSGNLSAAFYDIERIEVVRGPQGVLLGKNVAGGAINIISNPPSFDPSGRITVAFGNYDLKQTFGHVTGPLTDDLAGRLSFQSLSHSGYARDLLHNVDLENLDSVQGRVQLAYQPDNSDLRATLIVDYAKDSGNGVSRIAVKSPTLTGANPWSGTRTLIAAARGGLSNREVFPQWPTYQGNVAASPQGVEHETYNVIFKLEKDVAPNIRFSSITGYRNNKSYLLYDQTGVGPTNGFNFTAGQLAAVNSSFLFTAPVNYNESVEQFSQEFRLTSTDADSRFDWILGAYYLHNKVHQFNRFWGESLVLPTLSGEAHWDDNGRNQDTAVFGQIGYKVTDRLKLEVGVRYTKDKKDGTQQGLSITNGDRFRPLDTAPITPLVTPFARTPYGASWSEVTPQVILRWTPTDTMMAYATVSKGFKGGGFQNNAPNAFAAAFAYDPETVTNYEVGYKAEFMRSLRWNTALFYMKYKNLQVQQTVTSCLCNVISNAPGATIKGVETDLQYAPNDWIRAWGSASYVHGTYDEFVFGGVNNSGKLLQRTPKWQVAVGAEATMDVGSWEDALVGRLSYRWQGKMPWAPENTTWEKAYGTLDGRLTLTLPDRGWSVSLFGKNLADTTYRTSIQLVFADELSSYGAPRTFGVELSAPF
jgi:iron complex outermembrane recepter protein